MRVRDCVMSWFVWKKSDSHEFGVNHIRPGVIMSQTIVELSTIYAESSLKFVETW